VGLPLQESPLVVHLPQVFPNRMKAGLRGRIQVGEGGVSVVKINTMGICAVFAESDGIWTTVTPSSERAAQKRKKKSLKNTGTCQVLDL